ncbi:MAG: DegT/DnrJ/EryC1/StrS family aminotransferase [Candidatus Hermodarchaeota archaeon]
MDKNYPLFDIYWDKKDIENVVSVIKRGSYWAIGPEIKDFEDKLSDYFNSQYCITFNSGTSALHAVLLAYGITSGEAIVPSMSFIATANCVILAGAKPIFAEIEDETLGLDPEDVKEKITDQTKVIIPMHYGGKVCKHIEALREIADDYKLVLIEDNAESFGAKIKNRFTGTIGNAGVLSFCQNKIITTGEGGAVITDDKDIFEKLLLIRSHGRVEQKGVNYFSNINEMDYIEIGYNFRLPSIGAALGISQLEKIEKIIRLRREKGKFYDKILTEIPQIKINPELEGTRTVYQLYTIFLKNPEDRSNLQEFLLNNGIYTKIYFPPIHLKTYYKNKFGYKEGDFPNTEKISKKILSLPFSLRFKDSDQKYIATKIKQFFEMNH